MKRSEPDRTKGPSTELADRRLFVLRDADWEAFQEVLEGPVVVKPRLSALVNEPDLFDD